MLKLQSNADYPAANKKKQEQNEGFNFVFNHDFRLSAINKIFFQEILSKAKLTIKLKQRLLQGYYYNLQLI